MSETTSLTLLDRLQAARPDPRYWKQLVDLYTPWIRMWLRRWGIGPADTDDLTQEVLAVVVRELPRFHHNRSPGAFRSWLKSITINRIRALWRSHKRRPQGTGDSDILEILNQLEDANTNLSRQWDREHDQHVIRQLLQRLNSEFSGNTWKAFEHTVLEERSPAAVAKKLGISVNAVLLAKSRVLRRLRLEAQGFID
jgi:RNA polymerase sigma-70 factor (ECF subfamily)